MALNLAVEAGPHVRITVGRFKYNTPPSAVLVGVLQQ